MTSAVSFDPATRLYTYTYRIDNAAGSAQQIRRIDVTGDRTTQVDGPPGWVGDMSHDPRVVMWVAIEVDPSIAEQPIGGASIPPSIANIKPGFSLGGFTFKSINPPGQVSYVLYGYAPVPFTPANPEEADEEWEELSIDLLDRCPQHGKSGVTIGPVASAARLPAPPPPPSFDNVTDDRLTLRWEVPPGGAASYEIELASSPGMGLFDKWFLLASDITSVAYEVPNLAPDATYRFRVRGLSEGGAPGPWSAAASVETKPEAPESLTVSDVTSCSVRLEWETPRGIYAHRIERAPDVEGAAGEWSAIEDRWRPRGWDGMTYRYSDSVAPGTTYWYRIASINDAGRGPYNAPVAVTTLAGQCAPGR